MQFLHIALGSAVELETQLIIAANLGFVDNAQCLSLCQQVEEIGKMLNGLIKYKK